MLSYDNWDNWQHGGTCERHKSIQTKQGCLSFPGTPSHFIFKYFATLFLFTWKGEKWFQVNIVIVIAQIFFNAFFFFLV